MNLQIMRLVSILILCPSTSGQYFKLFPDGSYDFNYHTSGNQHRSEVRYPDGTVLGKYAYVAPNGEKIEVEYNAGVQGYREKRKHSFSNRKSATNTRLNIQTNLPQLSTPNQFQPGFTPSYQATPEIPTNEPVFRPQFIPSAFNHPNFPNRPQQQFLPTTWHPETQVIDVRDGQKRPVPINTDNFHQFVIRKPINQERNHLTSTSFRQPTPSVPITTWRPSAIEEYHRVIQSNTPVTRQPFIARQPIPNPTSSRSSVIVTPHSLLPFNEMVRSQPTGSLQSKRSEEREAASNCMFPPSSVNNESVRVVNNGNSGLQKQPFEVITSDMLKNDLKLPEAAIIEAVLRNSNFDKRQQTFSPRPVPLNGFPRGTGLPVEISSVRSPNSSWSRTFLPIVTSPRLSLETKPPGLSTPSEMSGRIQNHMGEDDDSKGYATVKSTMPKQQLPSPLSSSQDQNHQSLQHISKVPMPHASALLRNNEPIIEDTVINDFGQRLRVPISYHFPDHKVPYPVVRESGHATESRIN